MLGIPGYQIFAQIYESANSLVYRGIRDRDSLRDGYAKCIPIILKLLKEELPTPAQLLRYQQEYQISQSLNLPGVVKVYSLEKYHNSLAIIFEDVGAESLNLWREQRQITLEEFLPIAIKTVDILGQIHTANIIHKDINPSNIIVNPKTGEVKIIDFGISTVLSIENPTLKSPNVLEGTLAYIAPEQTGRMNRAIDYRADFYSLGATFYEMLTNRLPFEGNDALELVHCHIAKQPIPPQQVNSEIPKPLSDIIMKLLAKTAEDRYQSAWGIQADLELCITQLQTQGKIEDFPLSQHDISNKFQIPQKLYGRETEIEILLAAFEQVAGSLQEEAESATSETQPSSNSRSHSEMMLVFGYSGIGKSALVQEIYKPITRKKGYFIAGKFDQFQRNIPYSAIIKAFQELVRQLLAETEAQLQQWREKILAAVGVNGQVIIDVIPDLKLIVGKQPELSELPPAESKNRFNLVFHNFIRVFCKPKHPLVIFLDDLQWADSATLQLLQLIMTDAEMQYLFMIGAYRDNEVSAAHPLMLTINEIQKTGCVINSISLVPLKLDDVNQLISDTLKCDLEKTRPLAELVQQKTQGNPFFINEFLKSLYAEELLKIGVTPGGAKGEWHWDLKQIQAKEITDNVVELMAGKIQKMSQATQQLLNFAACIGNQFDVKTLAIVTKNSVKATNCELLEAIRENLIIPIGDDYKLLEFEQVGEDLTVYYKFLHDRVQQAAYSLITEPEKQVVHSRVGQLLLENTAPEQREQKIFDIVNHLNFGSELIAEQPQLNELAALNLLAGKKAKASAAYKSALDYFAAGRKLLSADSWQTQYDLTLNLYQEAAEAAYISTDFELMDELANSVLQQAQTVLDKVKVYQAKILAQLAQSQLRQAVDTALLVLELLDIHFPKQPTSADIQSALQTTQAALTGREIEDLIHLPPMTAPDKLAAMQVISSTFAAVYFSFPEMLPLFIFKQVNLSLEYGNAPYSLPAYANCGLLLSAIFNDIESGYRFGELALTLLERINSSEVKAETLHIVNGFVKHCKESVRKTLKLSQDAYTIGLETGDIEYACHAASMYALHAYFIGKELTEFERELAAYSDMMRQLKQEADLNFNEIYRQAVLNLMERSENSCKLIGDAYNEDIQLPLMVQSKNRSAVYIIYLQKTILCYLFGEFTEAVKYADLAAQDLAGVVGSLLAPLFYFYDSLVRLAVYFDVSESDCPKGSAKSNREQILEQVNGNLDRLKVLATHAPTNYLHKVELIEAELCRIKGQNFEAMDWYDHAIATARENEYINEEALSYELAAKFYISKNKTLIAKTYLQNARYYYLRWGASAKVKDLDTRYPQLLLRQTSTSTSISGTKTSLPSTSTDSSNSSMLDFTTVIKASQAISGEVVLASLLSNLIKLAIENAGAQKGFLILLNSNGELRIEAAGDVDGSIQVLHSLAVNNSHNLPISIINYVARTQSDLVLNDVACEGSFTADPYFAINQPKSVLCAPIINQGKLIGILYLENNLAIGAFTADRLAVLSILSAQAAISLENAQLYQTLEQKVEERTAQLAQANAEILILNERLKAENLRMSAELDVTRRLQQMILPKQQELESIEGLEIAGFMEPADEVGGDYYDVLNYDGKATIGIGDVTGHGLESGVLMIMAQTAIRTLLAHSETDPVKLLQTVNQTLFDNVERIKSGKNMTLSLLEYQDNTLRLSGQHEEVIIVRNSGEVERINTIELGFPLALEADIADFIASTEIPLNYGDVVVLYTDGITEAFDMNNAEYGIDQLIEVVALNREQSAAEIKQAVIDDLRRYIGKQKVFDDITLVVIKHK